MTSGFPTRFENYPPSPGADAPATVAPEPAPVAPVPTRAAAVSRRGVVAAMIGVPLVVVAGAVVWSVVNDESEEAAGRVRVDVGRYSAVVSVVWTVLESSDDVLVLGNGANRVYAWPQELPPTSAAVDELGPLVKQALREIAGFTTSFGEPVDASTADVQRASLAGEGSLGTRPCRLVANLWIAADGQALLTARLLTSEPRSDEAFDAQQIVDDLAEPFR